MHIYSQNFSFSLEEDQDGENEAKKISNALDGLIDPMEYNVYLFFFFKHLKRKTKKPLL
jgi:hypothetical protein